jgi:MFS family permease
MSSNNDNPRPEEGMGGVFRALRSRNYRLFFAGQGISLVGTWLQNVALSWLVFKITHSALMLGLTGFAGQIPALLLGPFSGVMIDRWHRLRLLLTTQTLSMAQAGILAALVLTHHISIVWVVLLSMFIGAVNAFDIPARQAFVIQMIENHDDLPNAIALNSSMFNGARLIGPSVAGMLLATVGEGMCFLLNSVSYLAVLAALLAMKVPASTEVRPHRKVWVELREGLTYAAGFGPIRTLLLLLAFMSLVAMPYMVLMPVFATTVLHGNATTLGFLTTATGVGALVGALYMASRRTVVGLENVILLGTTLFGAGLITFSASHYQWLSLAMLMVTGFGMMLDMASANTLIQTLVEDDKRGRVMSLYAMAFMGTAPFGSLLAGALAHGIGAPRTLALCGACCFMAALAFFRAQPGFRSAVRPVYERSGILPGRPELTPAQNTGDSSQDRSSGEL